MHTENGILTAASCQVKYKCFVCVNMSLDWSFVAKRLDYINAAEEFEGFWCYVVFMCGVKHWPTDNFKSLLEVELLLKKKR